MRAKTGLQIEGAPLSGTTASFSYVSLRSQESTARFTSFPVLSDETATSAPSLLEKKIHNLEIGTNASLSAFGVLVVSALVLGLVGILAVSGPVGVILFTVAMACAYAAIPAGISGIICSSLMQEKKKQLE